MFDSGQAARILVGFMIGVAACLSVSDNGDLSMGLDWYIEQKVWRRVVWLN